MESTEERVKLPDAAKRLGITTREALDWIDRGDLECIIDREEGRIYVPARAVPA